MASHRTPKVKVPDSSMTNNRPDITLSISDVEAGFGSMKLAAAAISALTLITLSLLLAAARPAQAQTETVLYNFTGGRDGRSPAASLISDGAGNFYGNTGFGGLGCPGNELGCGTAFEISPNGSGGWKEKVLHSFSGPPDAANPFLSPMIFDKSGNLYCTTQWGGEFNLGAVVELSPAGTTWTATILYSFTGGADGGHPVSSLIMDGEGNLYGTTKQDGAAGGGTVFKLAPAGTLTVLYSFGSKFGDGLSPNAGLTLDQSGNFYGTTVGGGVNGVGTVFKLTPTGTETVLHAFGDSGDGAYPYAVLVFDKEGSLYGTTQEGGAYGQGMVFKLTPAGAETALYSFGSQPGDGSHSFEGLIFDQKGNLYGTTYDGGANGQGTVFELTATGAETVLYSFGSQPADGSHPWAGLIFGKNGNLYGDTNDGGTYGAGVIFEVTPVGVTTGTTLVSSLNPSIYGQAVTFTATITSTVGTPPNGEIITFYNGTAVLGTAPLSGGVAALTTSSLPAGIFTITARYPGDSNFFSSTSAGLRQVVNSTTKSVTLTTFTSSLNPSIYGQKVTFAAKVTTAGAVTPTGYVAFTWGGIHTIGSAPLNSSGVASFSRSNLNADPYPLTAAYSGDANNLSSTSPVVNQLVLETTSAATITASPNPSTVGQAVTFSAQITSPTVTPTGPVTFTAGKTVLGTAQLSGGKATFTTSALPAGSTVVTLTYNGDSNIAKSTASVTQVVHP